MRPPSRETLSSLNRFKTRWTYATKGSGTTSREGKSEKKKKRRGNKKMTAGAKEQEPTKYRAMFGCNHRPILHKSCEVVYNESSRLSVQPVMDYLENLDVEL
jgi:hypothetical protein